MNRLPPQPQSTPLGLFRIFSKIRKKRFSQVKVHHRCQRHRWQICHRYQRHRWQTMGTISGCRYLKVNLKAKMYIYANSATQRCPNKIIKIFLIEDFFHLPPVSLISVVHLEPRISPRIFEKIWNGRNDILRCLGGNWYMKKNRSQKSRSTVPLK